VGHTTWTSFLGSAGPGGTSASAALGAAPPGGGAPLAGATAAPAFALDPGLRRSQPSSVPLPAGLALPPFFFFPLPGDAPGDAGGAAYAPAVKLGTSSFSSHDSSKPPREENCATNGRPRQAAGMGSRESRSRTRMWP
jgi:hypothetical protein